MKIRLLCSSVKCWRICSIWPVGCKQVNLNRLSWPPCPRSLCLWVGDLLRSQGEMDPTPSSVFFAYSLLETYSPGRDSSIVLPRSKHSLTTFPCGKTSVALAEVFSQLLQSSLHEWCVAGSKVRCLPLLPVCWWAHGHLLERPAQGVGGRWKGVEWGGRNAGGIREQGSDGVERRTDRPGGQDLWQCTLNPGPLPRPDLGSWTNADLWQQFNWS